MNRQLSAAVHSGDSTSEKGRAANQNWQALTERERDAVIEFLKTLQVLPEGTKHVVVDENGDKKRWA